MADLSYLGVYKASQGRTFMNFIIYFKGFDKKNTQIENKDNCGYFKL